MTPGDRADEPTAAEIEAGARAVTALCTDRRWRDLTPRECAEAVLRAVLSDHDARLRAEIVDALEVLAYQNGMDPTIRRPEACAWLSLPDVLRVVREPATQPGEVPDAR
jgi:hypothetical protein